MSNIYRTISAQSEQPLETQWLFIEELKKPLHTKISWDRKEKTVTEADLSKGVSLHFEFQDSEQVLETSSEDFRSFLKAGNISVDGNFKIITERVQTDEFESYRVEITSDFCRIQANDTEGIRRGLIFVEDEMLRSGGPFLPWKIFKRKPVIKTRISRCFFSPIGRPPKNRDELLDDVEYYPDEYLNRLAHEGINGLWLTIKFKDLCTSGLFSEHGQDAERRLEKLSKTVEKCRKYGIKIYLFCIEPRGFGNIPEHFLPLKYAKAHPEITGHKFEWETGISQYYFCTSSEKGQKYIKDCRLF